MPSSPVSRPIAFQIGAPVVKIVAENNRLASLSFEVTECVFGRLLPNYLPLLITRDLSVNDHVAST